MSNVELKYIINFNIDNKFLMINSIPVFIGYDHRERAATNVLIDSLYQNSSLHQIFQNYHNLLAPRCD